MFNSPFAITLTALLVMIGSACTPKALDRVAIYEKNTGKQPVQAQLLASIAVGYAQLGQREKASKLLSPALQTAKRNKSIHIKSDLLEKLGIIYVEMGQYDKAFQVAKLFQLYNPIDKDIELKHITTTMTAAGQYDKALQVAKLISIGGISSSEEDSLVSRSTVMAGVAVKYTEAGQKAKAEQILAQALELARTVKEKAEVANKYAEVGQQAKALQILARASEGADEADEMAAVAVKYAEVGQKYKAEQMLARALQITNNKKDGSFFKDHDLTTIAINYAELGQKDKTEQLLAQALLIAEKLHQ